ncbi:MAG: DMT family transporter [Desulfobacteraceae bacterium]|nr:DMT family transporter [Desulfobacteraceae bacterium]
MKIKRTLENPILTTHIAVFLFGFSGLFGKFFSFSPIYIVLGRTFFASLALLTFIYFFKKAAIRPASLKDAFAFALQGLLLAFHWVCFFYSIQISTVAVGLLTFSTFPLFVTFLEPLFCEEKLYIKDIILACLILVGTSLIIPSLDFSNNITKGGCVGILAGFTFAVLAIVNRKNAKKLSPFSIALHQNFFATLFLLIPAFLISSPLPLYSDLPLLAVLGILCTALSHSLFIKSLVHIKAQTVSIITGLEPVWGITLAVLFFNEIPNLKTVIGGSIIIFTSFLTINKKIQKTNK